MSNHLKLLHDAINFGSLDDLHGSFFDLECYFHGSQIAAVSSIIEDDEALSS